MQANRGGLKIESEPKVYSPGCKIIRYGILLCENCFYPSISGLISYLHEVEYFETGPGGTGEVGPAGSRCSGGFDSAPQQERKANIYAVIRVKPIRISINDVVTSQSEWKAGSHREIEVHFEVLISGQVVLKINRHGHEAVGGTGDVVDRNSVCLSDFAFQMLYAQDVFAGA